MLNNNKSSSAIALSQRAALHLSLYLARDQEAPCA
jgi:hypothetical protein